jgi:hypothetical protein
MPVEGDSSGKINGRLPSFWNYEYGKLPIPCGELATGKKIKKILPDYKFFS